MARPLEPVAPALTAMGPADGPPALLLPGLAAERPTAAEWAQALAGAGMAVSLLAWPGQGPQPWPLPPQTGLMDLARHAGRAAGPLGRPLLLAHGVGALAALKLLEVADLPALLLAPPAPPAPLAAWRLTGLPARLRWEIALGAARPRPPDGSRPRLVVAAGSDPLGRPAALAALARRIGAGFRVLAGTDHRFAPDPGGRLLGLLGEFAELART